jgi:limonene-1,2-epoxide hydrolase
MSTEIEALEQFYAAINRNDMQAIIKDFDPQIVRIEPEGFPTLAPIVVSRQCKSTSRKDAVLGPKEPASPRSSW